MNLFIIFESELVTPSLAVLSGPRREKFYREQHAQIGAQLRVGLWGGKLGTAHVKLVDDESVELSLCLDGEPPKRTAGVLIVAVPRPQTIKKVVHTATTMGVNELYFVRSANVVKSYMQSKSLGETALAEEVLKGLEQACDTCPPQIFVHKLFKPFIEDCLPEILSRFAQASRIIAHTKPQIFEDFPVGLGGTPCIAAIGPESGWTPEEVQRFASNGFKIVNLGERILRVETAVAAILGRVLLSR